MLADPRALIRCVAEDGARSVGLVITAEADQGLSAFYARFGFRASGRTLMSRETGVQAGSG